MVINSRSGSHQVLLRQLQQGIHTVDQEEEEEEEEENPEEENLEEEEEAAAQISTPAPNVAAGGGGGEEEEEEEEDLFGQIACANPELLQQSPIQVRGSSQGLGRDDWGDGATLALLQAWGDKCVALNKWHLRLDHWAELAAAVTIRSHSPKTDVQCKNRVDTLKKKFKQERQKQSSLGSPSKWPFYRILDRLLGMASNAKNSTATTTTTPRSSLPIGADAGNIVKNSGKESKPRPSKRQHYHPSSSEEEEEEEGNDDDLDEDLQDHEEQEDLLWVLNFKTKKRGGGNAAKKKKKRKMGSPSSSSSSSSPLAGAIAKLGEIFERMEECKRQQLVDLEKIRMQFTKDLELHRMQLLMQAQMELAKIKHSVDIQ
ncbi:trihelix transcription factor ASIL1 [Selaginella moellendorffii]|nr:trihelix transcription factor ASIL1 [Selaginella moellendorffii]|eukprot:XP_002971329.2 trihelix transcription factor ASIL1 [Selaginella moellendorffii]